MAKKTLYTMCFEIDKLNGQVENCGKCYVANGNQSLERTLWHNTNTGEFIVMVNGNAWTFKPYRRQHDDGIMRGFI